MKQMVLLSPTAILGYGFPAVSFENGLSCRPHAIAVDAGSTDPGPYYLGSGKPFVPRGAVKRDLTFLLRAARSLRIPLLIGTAGGSGARQHLEWCRRIILEVADEEGLSFRMAVIPADVSKQKLAEALRQGRVSPLGPVPELTEEAINESTNLVAQMGVEPLIEALDGGAEVVLAGRCYDPAVFAALPIREGYDPGLSLHLGKILECAAIAAVPGSGSDCMIGFLEKGRFLVEAASPERRATTASVAAHTLYEKSNPYLLPGPGGVLDLQGTAFRQVNGRRVAVAGSRFRPVSPYRVKVEGARKIGYRVVSIAGARDPRFISALEEILAGVRERTEDNFSSERRMFRLAFHVYGRDGVMGKQEPRPVPGHEVGIVLEAVAETEELAEAVCGFARSTLLHYGFPGRLATAGNLAFPFSPSDFKAGGCLRLFGAPFAHTVSPPGDLPGQLRGGAVVKPLVELAQVIRTKNAGPYELTLDIIFKDRESYERVKRNGSLNAALIARLYGVPEEDILEVVYFDPALAFKATMKRPLPCGDPGERDIYGAQQHAPLLDLCLPWGDEDEGS